MSRAAPVLYTTFPVITGRSHTHTHTQDHLSNSNPRQVWQGQQLTNSRGQTTAAPPWWKSSTRSSHAWKLRHHATATSVRSQLPTAACRLTGWMFSRVKPRKAAGPDGVPGRVPPGPAVPGLHKHVQAVSATGLHPHLSEIIHHHPPASLTTSRVHSPLCLERLILGRINDSSLHPPPVVPERAQEERREPGLW